MNKKEVSEIRKTFTKDKTCITRIAGCYVDSRKNTIMSFIKDYGRIEEEEQFKYMALFKKSLAGKLGEKLIGIEFPNEAEEPGHIQPLLMKLRDSQLKDEAALEEFYDKVKDTYIYAENYLILVMYGIYDVPCGRGEDNGYVYPHIMCCICPVTLSKEGLCYMDKDIKNRVRDWVVGESMHGFLFPAFNDRNSDIHEVLYHTKKAKDIMPEFISGCLEAEAVSSAEEKKLSFNTVIERSFNGCVPAGTALEIYGLVHDRIKETGDCDQGISKKELRDIIEEVGADKEQMSEFEAAYESQFGTGPKTMIFAETAIDSSKLTITLPEAVIKIKPDYANTVSVKEIDGQRFLAIPIQGDVTVDGISVR